MTCSTVSSLTMMPSRKMPSWPWLVKGSSAASVMMPISGTAALMARVARLMTLSGSRMCEPVWSRSDRSTFGKVAMRRDAELCRALGLLDGEVDGQAEDAGHGGDLLAAVLAVDDEDRPDQVVDGQPVLLHQPARPVGLAHAAQPARAGDLVDGAGRRLAGRVNLFIGEDSGIGRFLACGTPDDQCGDLGQACRRAARALSFASIEESRMAVRRIVANIAAADPGSGSRLLRGTARARSS